MPNLRAKEGDLLHARGFKVVYGSRHGNRNSMVSDAVTQKYLAAKRMAHLAGFSSFRLCPVDFSNADAVVVAEYVQTDC